MTDPHRPAVDPPVAPDRDNAPDPTTEAATPVQADAPHPTTEAATPAQAEAPHPTTEAATPAQADAPDPTTEAATPAQADAPLQLCPTCGEVAPFDANWCEACGNDLDAVPVAPKSPCVSCAASSAEITDDGWCQLCGTKQPAPEDHVVADHGWFALVSDRGKAHRVNEDAGAVAPRPSGVVLVVCDGVSSTDESQNASQVAAAAVAASVADATWSDAHGAFMRGAASAQRQIMQVSAPGATDPPSCTLAAAAADIDGAQAELQVGWLGDSRVYWVDAAGARQLTRDHSWAMEQLAIGELDPETIHADRRAGSITRWLGADSADVAPEMVSLTVELPGTLLACSDGLWNYASTEAEMDALLGAGPQGESPLELAERLVGFANDAGGHDNITVAIADLQPQARSSTTSPGGADQPAALPETAPPDTDQTAASPAASPETDQPAASPETDHSAATPETAPPDTDQPGDLHG